MYRRVAQPPLTLNGRIGETKTTGSNAYVSISDDLFREITLWLSIRNMSDPYHRNRTLAPNDLLFPSEAGTPYRIGNYLKGVLRPAGQGNDPGHDLPGFAADVRH